MHTIEPDQVDEDNPTFWRDAEATLLASIATAWTRGWQPTEIARLMRRMKHNVLARLTLAVIAVDHARRAPATLDARWAAQVDALELPNLAHASGWLAEWARREQVSLGMLAQSAKLFSLYINVAGPLPVLIPPPGAAAESSRASYSSVITNDPMLNRVRALLAQAESTNFEAEAETFTAKAQELMTRYAIDTAMLTSAVDEGERPTTIRIAIDDPYFKAKCRLLSSVAKHSRCRVVLHTGIAMASVTGLGHDVTATELLFTSLLVQVQTAMNSGAAATPPGSRERTRSFRASFVIAYAYRVGERLAEINRAIIADAEAETGRSLLPVLAGRSARVDRAVEEMFGVLHSSPSRARIDGDGWASGRMAADRAQLNRGDLGASRPRLEAGRPP